jgi:hypothetical protein
MSKAKDSAKRKGVKRRTGATPAAKAGVVTTPGGGKVITKRSGRLAYINRLQIGAAAAAGAVAGAAAALGVKALDGLGFKGTAQSPPIGGSAAADPAAGAPGASGVAGGGDGFGAGGVALRFDVACLKPGATRDFLRARYPGPKPQFAIASETGIPADTVRKAMAWQGASELSGPHLMRMVSVFGPPFLAAVLDPVPRWVSDWMEATHG